MVVAFGVLVLKNRGAKQETDQLQPITSYDQIYEHYEKLLEKNDPYVLEKNSNLYAVMNGTGNTAMTQSDSDFAAQTADSPISYTSTNLREQGIGEADYTVTDGNYIDTLYSRIVAYDDLTGIPRYELELKICRAEEESAPVVATIGQKYEDNSYYGEWTEPGLYVYGDVLVLLHSECVVEGGWTERTNIRFYDITDRSQPKLLQENVQNGVYKECRVVDGILYVISATTRGMTNGLKKEKQERYVPMLNGQKLPQGDIYLREEVQGNAYDIVSSWDLSNQGKMVDVKAMIGYYQDIYMTQDSLYFSNTIYADLKEHDETDRTQISKFTCDNGKMRAVAVTTFPGTLDSSFAIQESGEELWVTAQVQHYVYREKLGDAGGNFRKDGAKAEDRVEGPGQDDIEDLDYWYGYEDYRTWTDVSVYPFDSKLSFK